MFTGLSAFPLTPFAADGTADEAAFVRLIERLADAGVDSIGALGSTGSYAYLRPADRARLTRLAVEHAGDIPVMVGVGALTTRDVLEHIDAAQAAGAARSLNVPLILVFQTPSLIGPVASNFEVDSARALEGWVNPLTICQIACPVAPSISAYSDAPNTMPRKLGAPAAYVV